ncbi:MAG: hypothetical protein KKD07_07485 [Candidatus Omnitrophica bacterium]|nr:hypothetical protein [Candidatus Omnitrophota bacterium]MBU1997830.1 hypothetical protein [Candidatus Omnitrophota bacterium]MBU4334264.1 hypothetical protein [Candidatus Omnitrophota bacterium]
MNKKKAILYIIILFELIVVFNIRKSIDAQRKTAKTEYLPPNANVLKQTPNESAQKEIEIFLNPPVEFDYLSKDEIYDLRKKYVEQHKDLVQGDYKPLDAVFGRIVDGKPWWGLRGQFCYGNGDRSIDGLSEESRFIANPFHLLYFIEGKAYREESCFPVYPRPYKLIWSINEPKAVAKYNLTKFYKDKDAVGHFRFNESFVFERMNAIDFGYNFIFIDPSLSKGVKPTPDSRVLKEVCYLRGFIHLGGSCGYPGGCNNGSPHQPELYFQISDVPAKIYCKLWKKRPESKKDEADFIFVVELD